MSKKGSQKRRCLNKDQEEARELTTRESRRRAHKVEGTVSEKRTTCLAFCG